MVQLVFPEDINPRGTVYGGRMMSWIATAGTLTASRCARGPVVLGAMDDLDFIHPVFLGEIVTISSQVEDIGRTSLELGVEVHSENPRTGVRRKTTSSHLAFIALDEHERPRPVGTVISPRTDAETAAHTAAAARKMTMVHLDEAGRPAPVPPFTPQTPEGRRVWREGGARRAQRKARMAHLRAGAAPDG